MLSLPVEAGNECGWIVHNCLMYTNYKRCKYSPIDMKKALESNKYYEQNMSSIMHIPLRLSREKMRGGENNPQPPNLSHKVTH